MMIPTVDYFEQTWLATGQSSLLKLGGSGIILSPISEANNQVEGYHSALKEMYEG